MEKNTESEREKFSKRLIERLLACGYPAKRGAESGVDVAMLAKTAGVTREMASRYVTGKATPESDKLRKIAEWLNVRIAYLRDGELPMTAQPIELIVRQTSPTYDQRISEEAYEMARLFDSLDSTQKIAVKTVANAFKKPDDKDRCA